MASVMTSTPFYVETWGSPSGETPMVSIFEPGSGVVTALPDHMVHPQVKGVIERVFASPDEAQCEAADCAHEPRALIGHHLVENYDGIEQFRYTAFVVLGIHALCEDCATEGSH